MTRIWCNGVWLDALDFTTAPTDRGLMHGLGLFETILALDGRPVFAELHIARFIAGCGRLGWNPVLPDLQQVMAELIETNELSTGRARIRLSISAGSGMVHDLSLGADYVVWLTAVPAPDPPHSTTANLSPWARNEHSALSGLKCSSYAENLVALQQAARLGFEETVFLNTAGNVCEAATSNVFAVRDGKVCTPPLAAGCLPGITRGIAMDLAGKLSIGCEETNLRPEDLRAADELFITSSIRGVMGLSRFEDRIMEVGPVTQALRQAWSDAARRKSSV